MELKYTEQLKFADVYPEQAAKLAQKLHRKKDDIPLIRKYYVEEIKDEDIVSVEDRTIISRISCANKDRDGESLLPSGVNLKNYEKNPIVCWGHSYSSPEHFVGKNVWIKAEDNGLVAKTVFAGSEFADQVFKAYTEDVGGTGPLLKGFSVGFIPHKWDDAETKDVEDGAPIRTYTDWELLEYSCVGIPCSPESLTLAHEKGIISKGFKDKIAKDYDIELEVEDDEVIEEESDSRIDLTKDLKGLAVADPPEGDKEPIKITIDHSTEFKMVIQLMVEQNEVLTELVKKLTPEEGKDVDIEIEDDNPDIDIEPDESKEPKKSESPKEVEARLAEDVRARLMGKVG